MPRARYAKQPTGSSCGPVAIINAAKFFGLPMSLKQDLSWLYRSCVADRRIGTPTPVMKEMLQEVLGDFLNIKLKYVFSIRDLISFLSRGDGCVILGYAFELEDGSLSGHWTLLTEKIGNKIEIINDVNGTISTISTRQLSSMLENQQGSFPVVFFLTER